MSKPDPPTPAVPRHVAVASADRPRTRAQRLVIGAVVAVVLAALPIYLESFWLADGCRDGGDRRGDRAYAVVGLPASRRSGTRSSSPSVPTATFLAGEDVPGTDARAGARAAAAAGADRRGRTGRAGRRAVQPDLRPRAWIYLGLASLGLVFLGQHILQNANGITGGYEGVAVPPFSLFGFSFSNTSPDDLVILGVPYGQLERLWYVGLVRRRRVGLVRAQPGRSGWDARWGRCATARSRPR